MPFRKGKAVFGVLFVCFKTESQGPRRTKFGLQINWKQGMASLVPKNYTIT